SNRFCAQFRIAGGVLDVGVKGCVTLPIAAFAGCLDELGKLCLSEITPPVAALHGLLPVTASTACRRAILTECRTASSAPRISISITTLSVYSVESTLISTSGVRSVIALSQMFSAFQRLAV